MELYDLHPIFEFFLVLYTGYLISTDSIKIKIDEKLNPFQEKYTELIKSRKNNLLSQIKAIREQRKNSQIGKFITRVAPDEAAIKIVNDYDKPANLQLDDIEKEIINYGKQDFDLFKSESQFIHVLKPYSLFFSFYNFAMLFIIAFPTFTGGTRFYAALLFFNICSFLFMLLVFRMSFYKKDIPKWLACFCKNKRFETEFIILLFILLVLLSGTIYYIGNILSKDWGDFVFTSSVFIAMLPILLYIIRLQIDSNKTSKILEAKWINKVDEDFTPRLSVIRNAFANPEQLMGILNTYLDSKDDTSKEKIINPA